MIAPQGQAPQGPIFRTPSSPQAEAAPQAQPQAQAPTGQPAQGQPTEAQPFGMYDESIKENIEKHLNTVPDNQKAFFVQYLTPELVTVLGILLGQETFDYFAQYTDPKKMLTVVERPMDQQQPQGQGPIAPGEPASQPSANVNQQPKMQAPASSIMGI